MTLQRDIEHYGKIAVDYARKAERAKHRSEHELELKLLRNAVGCFMVAYELEAQS